ncbi:MAG: hypothetical protein HFG27_12430 [Provencibacterium sp.]|jgi:hypothetical protein|nr:hypothetical protein [Provencibacterium sp.]
MSERGDEGVLQEELALFREYEALRRSLTRHERYCESLRSRIAELERSGKLSLPKYFGEFSPPQRTPEGELLSWQTLHEGVFLLETSAGRQLALHEAVAERYLTAVAAAAGEFLGDYCFFKESMVVALFELSEAFPDIRQLLSLPSLYAVLRRLYPAYVDFHNDIYPQALIPLAEGEEGPFLNL